MHDRTNADEGRVNSVATVEIMIASAPSGRRRSHRATLRVGGAENSSARQSLGNWAMTTMIVESGEVRSTDSAT